jgi:hypothetical protein
MDADTMLMVIDRADEIERAAAAETSRILKTAIMELDLLIQERGL